MSDQQNEELLTGQRSVESAQGYNPPLAENNADARAAEDKAVNDYVERTIELNRATVANEDMPLEIGYNKPDGSGRVDERTPVSPKKASEDLSRWREGLADIDTALKDQQFAEELERARSPLAKEIVEGTEATQKAFDRGYEAARQQQPADQTPQPEAPPLPPGFEGQESEELARIFQQHPKLLESMAAYSHQTDQKIAQAEQNALQYAAGAQRQAEDFVQASAQQAIAGVFVRHPELQGIPLAQLPTALAMIQRTSPEKHGQIMNEIAGIQGLLNQSNQVAQAQQYRDAQQYQQQWKTWSGEEDIKFVKAHPEMADTETASGVTARTRAYVNKMGFTDDDIARAWSGEAHISLRDARVQSMLYDAMRYRNAVASVPAARANAPVRVQQPGAGGQRASESEASLLMLSKKLGETHSAKDAALLLAARRMRGR
jgi:hypothetical protein